MKLYCTDMKRFNLSILLVLCLARWAAAQPASVFVNNVLLTTRTTIDDQVFINDNVIFYDLLGVNIADSVLFQTRDTLSFTNTGVMVAQPGFIFNTETATGAHSASSFNNSLAITALDAPPVAFYALGGSIAISVVTQPPGTPG